MQHQLSTCPIRTSGSFLKGAWMILFISIRFYMLCYFCCFLKFLSLDCSICIGSSCFFPSYANLHQVPDQAAAQRGPVCQQDLIQRGGAKDLSISNVQFPCLGFLALIVPLKKCSETIFRLVLGGVVTIVTFIFRFFHILCVSLCVYIYMSY